MGKFLLKRLRFGKVIKNWNTREYQPKTFNGCYCQASHAQAQSYRATPYGEASPFHSKRISVLMMDF